MAVILILLTILLPWLGALLVVLAGDGRERLQHTLAVGFSAAAGVASLLLLAFVSTEPAVRIPFGPYFGDLTFVPDGLGVFLTAIACVIGCLAVVFSVDYMKGEAQLGRFYGFVLLFIGSMVGLVLTGSLLFLFIFWEMTALSSYALISFYNDDPKAVAGGIKALIITQVGGVGLLVGALLAYANLGSYDIATLIAKAGSLPETTLRALAFGFLIAAAAKSAQFPFHSWLPDAMEAPTPVSALIHAATMVNAGVYLMARFYPAFSPLADWRLAVATVGIITAIIAGIMALGTYDLKRVLAFSTVSQLGLMFTAIGAGDVFASQFHLFSHAIFKALLFLGAGAVIHAAGTRDMRQMGATVGRQMTLVRNVFIVGAAALAGIPILNGFWSKELLMEGVLHGAPLWIYILTVLAAFLTGLYSLRAVWMTFLAPWPEEKHLHDAGTAMKTALVPLALGALLSWLLVGPFAALLNIGQVETQNLASLPEMAVEILSAPATLLALSAAALGLGLWWFVGRAGKLEWLSRSLDGLASTSFGLDVLNRWIVDGTQSLAEAIRPLQTGQANFNLLGIVAGLVVVLVWLALAFVRNTL
jgi:NADH-quinone oxidoreductase subunit L